MSAGPDPQVDVNLIEQTRKQINRLVEEVARLSEADLAPSDYYGEFLQRVLTAVAAPAGAVWVRTTQGHLQLQYQINLRQVGLDKSEADRQSHGDLLRQAAQQMRPLLVPPHSSMGTTDDGKPGPGNPTDYVILIAPILADKQIAGLIEIWQDADRNPNAQRGFLQFLVRMAELASAYTRNHQLRQMVGQQQIWTQLEAFARQIHGSLNPTEVAYHVANEGRRLIDCDRVTVAQRLGRRTHVESISGTDVVEKRSNLVRLMCKLSDKVLVWGEKLVYSGTKDEGLPPDVLTALDAYLAESNSKVLVVLPLKDERESESKKPPRTALMMECFDPSSSPEQFVARLEVVGRHATSALYNAAEHKRIPMRYLWQPLAKVQEGLGGKARAITYGIVAGLMVLVFAMIFVPYPLKMDSKGQLLPCDRLYVYSPSDGRITDFKVQKGDDVAQDQPLVAMYSAELHKQMLSLMSEIEGSKQKIATYAAEMNKASDPISRFKLSGDLEGERVNRDSKQKELQALIKNNNANPQEPGQFYLLAPLGGKVLNGDFQEQLTNRYVKPNEPILRVGNKDGRWEVQLKIPQKHIGQILYAFEHENKDELEVDLLLLSKPTQTYKGRLKRADIAGEAMPNKDENNEAEPVILASVRIDGDDIDPTRLLPPSLLVTGTEVHAKVRCGNRALGYALFYGVWEFLYEKVVFFF